MGVCGVRVVVLLPLVFLACLAISSLSEAVEMNMYAQSYYSLHSRGLADIDSAREKPLGHRAVRPFSKRYYVSTLTGSKKGHGTTANVYVKLYGSKGSTYWAQLHNTDQLDFERADCPPDTKTDDFVIQAEDVGSDKICAAKVRGVSFIRDPWYLVNMTVRPESGVTSHFTMNQLLTSQDIYSLYDDSCP